MSEKSPIVWVTGASSGIGKAISTEFINNGNIVAASARNKESLQRLKKEIGGDKKTIEIFPLDIRNSIEVFAAVDKVSTNYNINCLVNNAGSTTFKLAVDNTIEEIDEVLSTNLNGAIYAIKSVLPQMIERKQGTIINILSVAAEKVLTKSSAYAASKAGLLAYTKVLREELREKNIRIVNVLPGATRTPIWPNNALEKFGERMMSPTDLAKFLYQVYSIKSNMVLEEITIRPIKGDL